MADQITPTGSFIDSTFNASAIGQEIYPAYSLDPQTFSNTIITGVAGEFRSNHERVL
jgi:hypothetical protein